MFPFYGILWCGLEMIPDNLRRSKYALGIFLKFMVCAEMFGKWGKMWTA